MNPPGGAAGTRRGAWQACLETLTVAPVPYSVPVCTGRLRRGLKWPRIAVTRLVTGRGGWFTTGYPAASGRPAPGDPGCPAVCVGDSAAAELDMYFALVTRALPAAAAAFARTIKAPRPVLGVRPNRLPGAAPLLPSGVPEVD